MSNFNLDVQRDHGPYMWAGMPYYVFDVAVAHHDEIKGGQRHTARLTRIALVRETGEPSEYYEAKQTAALWAAHRYKGMPLRVNPAYVEDLDGI